MANEISLANASLPLHEVLEAEFVALHGELPADYPSSTQLSASRAADGSLDFPYWYEMMIALPL